MQCPNCRSLLAPGIDFCLICKQPVEVDEQALRPRYGPMTKHQAEEAAGAEALRTAPTRTPVAHEPDILRHNEHEVLARPEYSRFRSGPTSFSLPVKLFLTILILLAAPISGFWGWTTLFGIVYIPVAGLLLWGLWRRQRVTGPQPDRAGRAAWQLVAWAALGVFMVGLVAFYVISRQLPPDCQLAGEKLRWLIEFQTSSNIDEIYASPSRIERGVWLASADTDNGVAVWTSSIAPDDDADATVFPVNDAAVTDSISGIENEDTTGVVPGTKAEGDTEGIAVAIACVT